MHVKLHRAFNRRAVMPPATFRVLCLLVYMKVTVHYARIAMAVREFERKPDNGAEDETTTIKEHTWELVARQMGYPSLWSLSQENFAQGLGLYTVEVIAALTKGWCSFPSFGKTVQPLLAHHMFTSMFFSSFLLQSPPECCKQGRQDRCEDAACSCKNGRNRFYRDIFCNNLQHMNGMSYVSVIECFGLLESLLPTSMPRAKDAMRIGTLAVTVPITMVIGPLYATKLMDLVKQELKLAKEDQRPANAGFIGYAALVIVLVFGMYPSFGLRAAMRLKKMGTGVSVQHLSL